MYVQYGNNSICPQINVAVEDDSITRRCKWKEIENRWIEMTWVWKAVSINNKHYRTTKQKINRLENIDDVDVDSTDLQEGHGEQGEAKTVETGLKTCPRSSWSLSQQPASPRRDHGACTAWYQQFLIMLNCTRIKHSNTCRKRVDSMLRCRQ